VKRFTVRHLNRLFVMAITGGAAACYSVG